MNYDMTSLSNEALINCIKETARTERNTVASLVSLLTEMDSRRAYLERGYSSLFSFLRGELHYSEGAACRRIAAARVARNNPSVIEKLRSGSISLCALVEINKAPVSLQGDLITQSDSKPRDEVKKLVALTLAPEQRVKKIEKVKVTTVAVAPASPASTPLFEASTATLASPPPPELRYSVTLELTKEEMELLKEVQNLTGESLKSDAIVKALSVFKRLKSPAERAKRREERKARKVTATLKVKPEMNITSRHIPVSIRDNVHVRDERQCTYIGSDGHRCRERSALQLDHIRPYSQGGEHTEDNLRLMCPTHNRYLYEKSIR